jgi:aldehyde dehydrogenase (NAD+)
MEHLLHAFDLQRQDLLVPTADQRRAWLNQLWSAIEDQQEGLVEALHKDLGKPREEVLLHEVFPVKNEIRFARRHLRGWMSPLRTPTPLTMVGTKSFIQHQPKGQVLVIAPWNFPMMLALRPLVCALAAGNKVLVKPSEHTPQTAEWIAKVVDDALPPEVAKVILGGVEESAFLTSLPFQHICFTGGTGIGRKVMHAAAENLASVTLELGGKSPAIVDATVQVTDAAKRLAWGKFLNSGQVCISPDYLLVEDDIADAVVQEFVTHTQSMYGASPADQLSCVQRSRMINDHHFRRVIGLIEDALAQGARVVTGGTWDARTRRIAPTVLEDVTLDMAIMHEEIFGPVLPVIRWTTEEDLKRVLEATPHPLAMYFFSKDQAKVARWMAQFPSGTTAVNEVILQVAQTELPFGGIQTSGIGRTGGYAGFQEFSNPRTVVAQRSRFNILPLTFPPFTSFTSKLIAAVLRWL